MIIQVHASAPGSSEGAMIGIPCHGEIEDAGSGAGKAAAMENRHGQS